MSVQQYFETIAKDFDSYYDEPANWFQSLTNRYLRKPCILRRLQLSLEELDRPEFKTILDIGCGSGVLSIPLAKRGHQMIGLDFSGPMIEIAKHRTNQEGVDTVEWMTGDFQSAQCPSVDACVALGVLEYFPQPEGFIRKMLSLIPSGGKAIFDLPSFWNYHTPLRLGYLGWRKQRAYFYTQSSERHLMSPFRNHLRRERYRPYGAGDVVVLEKR